MKTLVNRDPGRTIRILFFINIILSLVFYIPTVEAKSQVCIMQIAGEAIGPVTTQYITQSIETAEDLSAECLVIELDTPGGLLESTHHIIKKILNSEVPIIVYVSPRGSRAMSAGTFITYAANIAAMAPATTIGAASPVDMIQRSPASEDRDSEDSKTLRKIIQEFRKEHEEADEKGKGSVEGVEPSPESEQGKDDSQSSEPEPGDETLRPVSKDVMMKKVENYAIEMISSLAMNRGRNVEWAVKAVRDAATLTETKALEQNVINLIASDLDDLLQKIDGMEVTVGDKTVVLKTADAQRQHLKMSVSQRILSVISNPNIVYILFIIGMLGITFEVTHPGTIFPGVIGVICLILAFYSLQVLPVNFAGIALLILAMVLFILEVKVTSYGLLALGGLIAMILGSLMLFDTDLPYMQVSKPLVFVVTIFLVGLFYLVLRAVLRTHQAKPYTGSMGILYDTGVATSDISDTGTIRVHGELWSAYSDTLIPVQSKVRVIKVEGLKLKVEIIE